MRTLAESFLKCVVPEVEGTTQINRRHHPNKERQRDFFFSFRENSRKVSEMWHLKEMTNYSK